MDWEKGRAIWKQIEDILVEEIRQGVYKPGDKLPTEHELAARFGVNRHTVRNTIASMADQQLTRVEQGRGMFVQEPVLDYPLGERTRFSQIVSGHHRLPDKTLLNSEQLEAGGAIAEQLRIKAGTRVIRLESVSEADGRPLAHAIHFLPARRFDGIEALFAERKSLTACFMAFGIDDYKRATTRIIAQMPTGRQAQLLKQPKTRPVLVTESVDVDSDAKPIQYGLSAFASDRVQLLVND
ncbi:MAG: phosphonate metabolism transcriptional regulator PhnF [Rhodospirillales bacterium]